MQVSTLETSSGSSLLTQRTSPLRRSLVFAVTRHVQSATLMGYGPAPRGRWRLSQGVRQELSSPSLRRCLGSGSISLCIRPVLHARRRVDLLLVLKCLNSASMSSLVWRALPQRPSTKRALPAQRVSEGPSRPGFRSCCRIDMLRMSESALSDLTRRLRRMCFRCSSVELPSPRQLIYPITECGRQGDLRALTATLAVASFREDCRSSHPARTVSHAVEVWWSVCGPLFAPPVPLIHAHPSPIQPAVLIEAPPIWTLSCLLTLRCGALGSTPQAAYPFIQRAR